MDGIRRQSGKIQLEKTAAITYLLKISFEEDGFCPRWRPEKTDCKFSEIVYDKLSSAVYSKNDGLVHISIENPVEFDIVKRYLAENNEMYDASFSSNVLKISL